jgi:DNA (cytosine-5)-methyltransferase 1
MAAYYNEIEPFAAEWLKNLIKQGLIADGEVDTRSIVDVRPDELRAFTQCHFFAGIGGWSLALRLAGWPDDRPIWTGSCPCQPFSVAGKGLGADDPRHLWPYFFQLISAVRPSVVMGEQVAGAAGYGWLDGVRADLEREGYASRGVDIPACAVDAPHIRQRLYWVARDMADAAGGGWPEGVQQIQAGSAERAGGDRLHYQGARSDLGDPNHQGSQEHRGFNQLHQGQEGREVEVRPVVDAGLDNLADAGDERRQELRLLRVEGQAVPEAPGAGEGYMADADGGQSGKGRGDDGEMRCLQEAKRQSEHGSALPARGGQTYGGHMADADDAERRQITEGRGHDNHRPDAGWQEAAGRHQLDREAVPSFWSNAIWLTGADGKSRRAEPSIPLLAHGIPGRVGRLRAYGNAIVPPLAAEVVRAFMEAEMGELPLP